MSRRADPHKPKRTFQDTLRKYRTYDTSEGFGSPQDWVDAFHARMGSEEATRIVNESKRSPRSILGLPETAMWADIKSAYRHLALQYHPDRIKFTGLTTEQAEERFKELTAAYTVLEEKLNGKKTLK